MTTHSKRAHRMARPRVSAFGLHPLAPVGAAVALALGQGAWAQTQDAPEATLKAVTVTAPAQATGVLTQHNAAKVGKSPASVQDTPFSISVINVAQMREVGAKTVEDALLYSAGVYAGRYGFDTRGDWAAVRGLSPSMYQDGLRSIYGFYNNVRPEIYALSSVEVLKGPSSSLYGQAELGGIVNVVSKQPQKTAAKEIEVQIGSHNRKQVAADITGPLNAEQTLLYRLVALTRKSDTQVDHVNDDALVLMPAITWQPNADTRVTATFLHQTNDSKVSSQFLPQKGTLSPAPLGTIPSNRFAGEPNWDRYDTRKNELSLSWDQRLTPDWKVSGALRSTQSDSVTREIYTSVGPIPTDAGNIGRTVHAADRKTDVLGLDVRLEGDVTAGKTRHKLGFGIDHQNATWEEFNYFSQNNVGSFNLYNPVYGNTGTLNLNNLPLVDRPDNQIVQTGLYVTDHMTWGPWVASAALRHDRARNEVLNLSAPNTVVRNTATTGRLGLMYQFASGVAPYISASNAFVPNLGTNGSTSAGFLKPTTGTQKEAGVKYLSQDGQTSASLAWFDIEQKNRVVDGTIPGGREQIGATTNGWELEMRQRLGALELMANYTQMDAINAATGKRLSSIAEKTASGWGEYHFGGGWRMGVGVRHIGNVTGANSLPVVPAVTLYDAMVGYTTGPWDFRLNLKNLADKQYVSWCRGTNQDCGYGERLSAALTARYRF